MSLTRILNLCEKDPGCDKNLSNKDKIKYIKDNWSPFRTDNEDTGKKETYWNKNGTSNSFWESDLLENLSNQKYILLDDEAEAEEELKNIIIQIIDDDNKKPKKYIRIKKYAGQWFIAIIVLFLILLITNIALTVSRNSQCDKVKNRNDPYYVAEDKKNSDASNLESFKNLQTQKSKITKAKTDDQTYNSTNTKYQTSLSNYENKLAEKTNTENQVTTDLKIEADKKAILEKLISDAAKGKQASDLALEYKKKYDELVIQCNNMQTKIDQAILDLATKKKLVDLTKCILAN